MNDRLHLIACVTNVVVGAVPLPQQARLLVEQVRQAFGVTACVVRTLEADELVLLACAGVTEEQLHTRIKSGWGISTEILESRRPLAIENVFVHPATAALKSHLPNPFVFYAYAGAPLLVEDRVVGILGIFDADTPRVFTDDDLDHLQIVANHIAVAILNSGLYREVQQQKERLEAEIAERKSLEAQLLHSQKMESIGRLAGGVAHDFNNLLTAILGYTELAQMETEPQSQVHSYLQTVEQAAHRAAALTQQLLTFARKQVTEQEALRLNDLILETDRLLRRLIGADVELVTLPHEGLGIVRADPNQITQVLINLVVNARDAMPQGGRLTIETANVTFEENAAEGTPHGDYVRLTVMDAGVGMSAEVQAHLFEPFFTTKDPGKGTGLGLATCYGIVSQSGGHIEVVSEVGQGASFHVYLPRITEEADAKRSLLPSLASAGAETILLVEDETLIRELSVQMLRAQGYFVLEATNGSEAMARAAAFPHAIDLLVTDVIMPHMGGKVLAEQLGVLRPALKVLYISGYSDGAFEEQSVRETNAGFLQKPFTAAMLTRKVREVLEATG